MSLTEPRSVPLPPESRITTVYGHVNLSDAYAIDLPPGTARSPEVLARFVFSHQPRWISILMEIRDTLVASFSLKTARSLKSAGAAGSRIGIFKVVVISRLRNLAQTYVVHETPGGIGITPYHGRAIRDKRFLELEPWKSFHDIRADAHADECELPLLALGDETGGMHQHGERRTTRPRTDVVRLPVANRNVSGLRTPTNLTQHRVRLFAPHHRALPSD